MQNKQEFYLGYAHKMPTSIRKFIINLLLIIFCTILCLAILMAIIHKKGHTGVSHGRSVKLEGVVVVDPYPMLLVQRKGRPASDTSKISRYYLVPPGKKGFSSKIANKWREQYVVIKGKVIYRDNQTMLVTRPNQISILPEYALKRKYILSISTSKSLGMHTIEGEIMDSKCYLGQMQPGAGKTHRSCATLCIRGGLPALFVAYFQNTDQKKHYFVLVSGTDTIINKDILPLVAVPVKVKGEIIQKDNLYFFKTNITDYHRVSSF